MRALTLAFAALVAAAPAGAARATGPSTLALCGQTTIFTDADGDAKVEFDSAPIALADAGFAPTATGTVTCSVHYLYETSTGGTHASYERIALTGPATTGVVALPPTVVPMRDDSWNAQVLCTRVTVDGVTRYWDDVAKEWSSSPYVRCWDGLLPGRYDRANVDLLVCPLLATQYPPEGDVTDVWDCPPYHW